MDSPALDGRILFTTRRLYLRSFRVEDLAPFAAMNADPDVMRYLGDELLTREQSDALAFSAQRSLLERDHGQVAVERIADGAFLGTCGLSGVSWYPGEVQAGWRLDKAYWGEGYASEAAAAWLAHGFDTLSLPRILAVADKPNARSIAVMRRLGFALDHEAELEDEGGRFSAVVYVLTAESWRAGQGAVE